MSLPYRIAYAVGVTPWENSGPAIDARLESLLPREESERGGPGKALDLGCGTGLHTATLARHGWTVTGVDIIDRALARARRRLEASGLAAAIVRADAARLRPEMVGDGFDLILDVGCFHSVGPGRRQAMARSVTRLAKPGSTMLMLAFAHPVGMSILSVGATRAQIETAYAAWTMVDVLSPESRLPGLPFIARGAEPTFYRLQLRDSPTARTP